MVDSKENMAESFSRRKYERYLSLKADRFVAFDVETTGLNPSKKTKENRVGKIQPVVFNGMLKVQVPEAMMTLVTAGVGPAKAFGCGLISLARV